jgi:hypothetical protein
VLNAGSVALGQREGEAMGVGFDLKRRNYKCGGDQHVTAKLNEVFENRPFSAQAMAAIPAFRHAEASGDPQHLIDAYRQAGVDVGGELHAWRSYLNEMAGINPQFIKDIAHERAESLTLDRAVHTKTHQNGNTHSINPGNPGNPRIIDSRCPPQ